VTRARSLLAAAVVVLDVAVACERPPVSVDPPPPDPSDPDVVDLTTFVQDRPAIGGKWYDYSVDGHVLTPRPHAWLIRAADGDVAGFRIKSVYDDDTGESGRFTIERTARPGSAWTSPEPFVVEGNVKDGEPLCVDLLTPAQLDCQQTGWHLRFAQQSRLSTSAGFAVAEPAVFLADDVVAARVDLAADDDLSMLPEPGAVADLDEAPPVDADSTDWDFSRFARDLPADGRVLGALSLFDGQSFQIVTTAFELATVTLTRGDGDTATLAVSRRPIDRDEGKLGTAIESTTNVDLSPPLPVFLKLDAVDLYAPAEKLVGASWPTKPPFAKHYDAVVAFDPVAGEPVLLLSPAVAARRTFDAAAD
jgi:hypothetical protein